MSTILPAMVEIPPFQEGFYFPTSIVRTLQRGEQQAYGNVVIVDSSDWFRHQREEAGAIYTVDGSSNNSGSWHNYLMIRDSGPLVPHLWSNLAGKMFIAIDEISYTGPDSIPCQMRVHGPLYFNDEADAVLIGMFIKESQEHPHHYVRHVVWAGAYR